MDEFFSKNSVHTEKELESWIEKTYGKNRGSAIGQAPYNAIDLAKRDGRWKAEELVDFYVKEYFRTRFHHDADRLKKDMGYRAGDSRPVSGETLKSLDAFIEALPVDTSGRVRNKLRETIVSQLLDRSIRPKAFSWGETGRSAVKDVPSATKKIKPTESGIGHMSKGKAAAIIAAVGAAAMAIASYFANNSDDSERLDTEMQALKAIVENAAGKDDATADKILNYALAKAKDVRSKIGKEPGYGAAPEQMKALRDLERDLVKLKDDAASDSVE